MWGVWLHSCKEKHKSNKLSLGKELEVVNNEELKSCLGGRWISWGSYDDYVWGFVDEVVVYSNGGGGGTHDYGDFWRGFGGGYNEDYGDYGGGNSSNANFYQTNPIKDGIDITNGKHFTFNTSANATFDSQLKDILATNKTIKGLLSYFDKGYVHLTFGIKNLGKNTAQTEYVTAESYHINFDSKHINEKGFSLNAKTDNISYDYSKTKNDMERLVVVIAHEAIHAKHYAVYQDAIREARGYPQTAANILLQKGYSQEFVEIYFVKASNGQWDYNRDGKSNDRAHQYMEKYDHGVIDKALEEYRKDRGLWKTYYFLFLQEWYAPARIYNRKKQR